MARPNYNLRESLYPALGALGTYTSNLAQYSGQMTPYKRDPRLDNQRAFGDALMAYMRAVPQREQMFQQREQLRIDRERQRKADERQRKLDQRQDELFPLQKELQQLQLGDARNQKFLRDIEIKKARGQQKILDNWSDFVTSTIDDPTQAQKFKRMGPSDFALKQVQSYVQKGVFKPVDQSLIPEKLKPLAPFFRYNPVTQKYDYPPDHIIDALQVGGYKVLNQSEAKSYLNATDEKDIKNTRVLIHDDPDKQPIIHKFDKQNDFDSDGQERVLAQGLSDPEVLRSDAYHRAYVKKYMGKQSLPQKGRFGETTGYISVDKIPPDPAVQPPPPRIANEVNQLIASNKGKETLPRLPQTIISKIDGVQKAGEVVMDATKALLESLTTFGTEKMGVESFNQGNLYGQIFSALQVLKNLGVPTGRDMEIVEMEIGNPSTVNIGRLIQAGGLEAQAIMRQIQNLRASVRRKLDIANAQLNNGIDISIFSDVAEEQGELSAEEFEESVQ